MACLLLCFFVFVNVCGVVLKSLDAICELLCDDLCNVICLVVRCMFACCVCVVCLWFIV